MKSTLRLPGLKVRGCLRPELRPRGSGLTLSGASIPRFKRRGLASPNGLRDQKNKFNIRRSKNEPVRVIILGAGGRDFHNFNTPSSGTSPIIKWSLSQPPKYPSLPTEPILQNFLELTILMVFRSTRRRSFLESFQRIVSIRSSSLIVMSPMRN